MYKLQTQYYLDKSSYIVESDKLMYSNSVATCNVHPSILHTEPIVSQKLSYIVEAYLYAI